MADRKRSKFFWMVMSVKESHWDTVHMSTKIPTMSQYSATETAFVSCSLSAFLSVDLKKKKLCGYIFVFCSKEFLQWGERVWTNRQADLRNDKHVAPVLSDSHRPLSPCHIRLLKTANKAVSPTAILKQECFHIFRSSQFIFFGKM